MKLDEIYFDGMELVSEPQIITVGCCKVLNKYQKFIKNDINQLAIDFNLPANKEFEVCKHHFKLEGKLYVPNQNDLKNIIKNEANIEFSVIKSLFFLSVWRYMINNQDQVGKVWKDDDHDQFIVDTYDEYIAVLDIYKNNKIKTSEVEDFKKEIYSILDLFI